MYVPGALEMQRDVGIHDVSCEMYAVHRLEGICDRV